MRFFYQHSMLLMLTLATGSGCRTRAAANESGSKTTQEVDAGAVLEAANSKYYSCTLSNHVKEFAGVSKAASITSLEVVIPPKFVVEKGSKVKGKGATVEFKSKGNETLFKLENGGIDLYDRWASPSPERISGAIVEPRQPGESDDTPVTPILTFVVWFYNAIPGNTGRVDFEQGKLHERSHSDMKCSPISGK